MPNKHAAEKALRKAKKQTLKNSRMKTHVKTLTSQFEKAVKQGGDEAKALAQRLQQALDKAAKNHVLHKNKARRKISVLHRALAIRKP